MGGAEGMGSIRCRKQNATGAVIANMLSGLNIDEYFIRTELSYLSDALGSTIALTDSTGTSDRVDGIDKAGQLI